MEDFGLLRVAIRPEGAFGVLPCRLGDDRLPNRFWSKVTPMEVGGFRHGDCWGWLGGSTSNGYGGFTLVDRKTSAHRYAYEHLVGPVPTELTLDHLCRVRRCVNPNHLEVTTRGQNVLRGVGVTAVNARKTECLRGHQFDVARSGRRHCRRCSAKKTADYRRRQDSVWFRTRENARRRQRYREDSQYREICKTRARAFRARG